MIMRVSFFLTFLSLYKSNRNKVKAGRIDPSKSPCNTNDINTGKKDRELELPNQLKIQSFKINIVT